METLEESKSCLFCRMLTEEEEIYKIWENETHFAFLTPFPNTDGFTVVASKKHLPSDVFALRNQDLIKLIESAKDVAQLLNKSFHTKRVGMIAEGMGVDHAHVKLVPLHGIPEGPWHAINSRKSDFFNEYSGYISSHDGPKKKAKYLKKILRKILKASNG